MCLSMCVYVGMSLLGPCVEAQSLDSVVVVFMALSGSLGQRSVSFLIAVFFQHCVFNTLW